MFHVPRNQLSGNGFKHSLDVEDFRKRQAADVARYEDADGEYVVRRRPFHERLKEMNRAGREDTYYKDETAIETDSKKSTSDEDVFVEKNVTATDAGEEAWRNKEGERLADFGVDEVADFYDEDDLPLAEIMRRRKAER